MLLGALKIMTDKYVIGLDYGSDSARALIVNVANGEVAASSVRRYPRWSEGKYCDSAANRYRQHPLDYLEVLEATVREALAQCPGISDKIVGIGIDTTGCTPAFTDATGTPLALLPEFAENPNAMFILWKDHTAVKEADEINALCKKWDTDYTIYEGSTYSSEWLWAKALHILREDPQIANAACSIVEHCDWLPAVLTGVTDVRNVVRSRCAAGHKAMWHTDWNGLPREEFFSALDPVMTGWRDKMYNTTETHEKPVGHLCKEWADKLGLSTDVIVAGGANDCHMGAVGAGVKEKTLVRVIGTSTCDVTVVSKENIGDKCIRGISGQVDGSVIPGMIGLEAGQSAFGDIYAWFRRVLEFPLRNIIEKTSLVDEATKARLIEEASDKILPALTAEAEKIKPSLSGPLAIDWMNGRRSPGNNQLLKGTITGLTLAATAPMIFRALVEATAFGTKAIADCYLSQGIEIDEVMAIGGIALKSPLVMQIMSDVLDKTIKVCRTDQACALGSAMVAAVAAGVYPTVEKAIEAMNSGVAKEYNPNPENVRIYSEIYKEYCKVGQFTETELFTK